MQPENRNPNQSPNPGMPQQPAQPGPSPFRRPIQPIAPRPYAASPTPAQQPRPQPQPFAPKPVQPVAPQPKPSVDTFASPPRPITQPTHSPQPQVQFNAPVQPAASQQRPDFNTPRPAFAPRPTQTQPDITAEPSASEFKMSLDFQQPQQKKTGLPKGTFVLVVFGIAGLSIGLMDKSQYSMIFNVVLALDLLAALLLFVRREVLSKAAFGLAVATVTVSAALALGYRGLADSTVKAEAMFIEEAKKLQNQSPTKQLTPDQQRHLDAMQLQLEAQQRAVGENSALVYGKYGGTIAAYALVALYLTRPKVKQALVRSKS